MLFKRYEHFHLLTTDRWTDSYSDYSAPVGRAILFRLKTHAVQARLRGLLGKYLNNPSVLVRAVLELIVSRINCGGSRGNCVGDGQIFLQSFVPVCIPVSRQC